MSNISPLRIAITPGEPAGIGPDLVIEIAQHARDTELVAIADPDILISRSKQLNLPLTIREYQADQEPAQGLPGELVVEPIKINAPVIAGQTHVKNAQYVLNTLNRAVSGCLNKEFAAMVTAPVHKSVIAESGATFSGHTEFLAAACGIDLPVMLLCTERMRVALLTTHLALRDVPEQITFDRICKTSEILVADLERLFGLRDARIGILGLNPHAGESGQLGREEIEIIEPAIARLTESGLNVSGPLPADSAFTHESLKQFDAILAMFHDQGLPVLKHAGFGGAINVTLGLPIIRTSVDHGTALSLAGTGLAKADSLKLAVTMAQKFASR